MNAHTSYKIEVCIEPREDGGVRVWSPDLPELVLSHSNAQMVLADIPRAMEVILAARLGGRVEVEELEALPFREGRIAAVERASQIPARREFAARAA